jgi:hypothetical protein
MRPSKRGFSKTGSRFKVQGSRLVEKGFLQPGTVNLEPGTHTFKQVQSSRFRVQGWLKRPSFNPER